MRGTAGITRSGAVASAKHAMRRPAAGTCQAATGLTASELQAQYGNILSERPLSDATSPYVLHRLPFYYWRRGYILVSTPSAPRYDTRYISDISLLCPYNIVKIDLKHIDTHIWMIFS